MPTAMNALQYVLSPTARRFCHTVTGLLLVATPCIAADRLVPCQPPAADLSPAPVRCCSEVTKEVRAHDATGGHHAMAWIERDEHGGHTAWAANQVSKAASGERKGRLDARTATRKRHRAAPRLGRSRIIPI